MEMVVIAVVAVVAFAAVLVPLFRRGAGASADASEFDSPASQPAPKPKPKSKPNATAKAVPGAARPGHAVDPDAGAGIVPPMASGPATPVAPTGATAPDVPAEPTVPDAQAQSRQAAPAPGDPVEAEVARYREALRAGTICRKCGEANPPGSRFCADCGADLPVEDADEFA
jgi:ribosomal protein L40E